MESIKKSLDEIEQALGGDDITADTLGGFRQTLNSAMDELRAKVDELEPRAREAEERLKQLGPAPAKDAPAEKEIADQREELTSSFNELDGELKQARVLSVRTDQLSERISQRRHALYASELFARTSSVFDPFFWSDAFARCRSSSAARRRSWRPGGTTRQQRARRRRRFIFALHRRGRDRVDRWWFSRLQPGVYGTRSAKAWMALWVFLWLAARTPAASFAMLLVWNTCRAADVSRRADRRGAARGHCRRCVRPRRRARDVRPEQPERRLVQEDDATAQCFSQSPGLAARMLGALIVLQVIHKTLLRR